MNKTFRGRITALGGSDQQLITRIRLSSNNGLIGYKIVKFMLMAPDASENMEQVVKVFSAKPETIDQNINFSDPTLIAAGLISQSSTDQTNPNDQTIYFDNTIFNQDIYVYNAPGDYSADVNYYIDLEVLKLDLNEATVATLKDMRGNYTNQDP